MGNEVGRLASDVNLAALLALSNLVDEAHVTEEDGGDKEVDHGWDPGDCSDKMTVLEDGRLVERRSSTVETTDAVRGKKAYRDGIHIWEIHWPVDERGSHAVIGVSVYESRLQANGFISLVGSNDQSVGWDISRNVLLFNDCIMQKYPEGKNHSTFKAPEIITVILNMTTGTISFKAGGEDYGMALSGLRGIGKPLSPTISATKDGCKVRIRYLGDKETATPPLERLESQKTTPSLSTPTIVVASYDYDAQTDDDLSFIKGDRLEILSTERDWWWRAKHLNNSVEGYIPSNYVKIENSIDTYDWYFPETTRVSAEKMLLNPETRKTGMFLVRDSESSGKGIYILSMVDYEEIKSFNVKHYKIIPLNDGRGFYISSIIKFNTLDQLIEHYKENSDGLCKALSVTCPHSKQQSSQILDLAPGKKEKPLPAKRASKAPSTKASSMADMKEKPLPAKRASKAPSTRASSMAELLTFHRRCGENVTLSANNKIAERYTESPNEGIVFSSRPLKPNERFEVKIERSINKWDGHMKIGIIDPPLEIVSSITSSLNESGKWYWSGSRVCHKGDVIQQLDYNINNLKDGSTVGVVRKQDGSVHFLYNGRDMGIAASNIPAEVHGIVDVYGDTVKVSLQGGETVSRRARSEQRSTQVRTMDDGLIVISQVNATIEMMKSKKVNNIGHVCVAIQTNLDLVYHANKDRYLRQFLGDHLADSADIIVEYLKYLKSCGINTSTEIWMAYDSLRNVCWNYAYASLKFATAVGQAGLLQVMVDDLITYKNYSKGGKSFNIVQSALTILYNCVKSTELRPEYGSLNVVGVIRPYFSSTENIFVMIALLITGYISDGDQQSHLIKANVDSLKFIVSHLELALDNSDTHQFDGFHAYEIATGITHLAAHPDNRKVLLKNDAVKWLAKMMKIGNDYEIECAANAIWCITTHDVAEEVKRTPGLMETIGKLESSDKETISAAVKRIDLRLKVSMMQQIPDLSVPMKLTCQYREDCKQFFKSLNIGDAYLFPKYDLCYCTDCHSNRGDKLYYSRGKPVKDYGLPIGWCRFSLRLPPKAEDLNVENEWHRAFHGTKKENVGGILKVGELLIPGDVAMGGKKLGEAPGHFDDKRKPEGFDTKQIFVSPSIRYSGHSAYATPSKYEHGDKSYIAKVAFLVLIRPNSYKIGQQTIGESHPIDPKFSNQEIEWSTKERGSTILYGLLVKLEDQGK